MFKFLFSKSEWSPQELVDRLMEMALSADLFERLSLEDNFDTRFDVVLMHMAVFRRVLSDDRSQLFYDAVFARLEMTLRQIGVGDMGLPHHMRRMMKAYYGRAVEYDEALDAQDVDRLSRALARNLYRDECYNAAEAANYMIWLDRNREKEIVPHGAE